METGIRSIPSSCPGKRFTVHGILHLLDVTSKHQFAHQEKVRIDRVRDIHLYPGTGNVRYAGPDAVPALQSEVDYVLIRLSLRSVASVHHADASVF